jgi:hypothetical protein
LGGRDLEGHHHAAALIAKSADRFVFRRRSWAPPVFFVSVALEANPWHILSCASTSLTYHEEKASAFSL